MNDLTLLYYTANTVEQRFADNIRKELRSFGLPIISVSQKPTNLGKNICVGDIGVSAYNIYKQILIGTKQVQTPFVAACEDDALYNLEHFLHRPSEDTFAYNMNRWNVNPGIFFHRLRVGMWGCIAPTQLMIETLEVRFRKFPEFLTKENLYGFGEPGRSEKRLDLPEVKMEIFNTKNPILTFNHRPSWGGVRKILPGDTVVRALPFWGDAKVLWERMWNG